MNRHRERNGMTNPDGDIVPAIHPSVIFAMDEPNSDGGLQYGRIGNRTREGLERDLILLHRAADGIVTASGSAATLVTCLTFPAEGVILHHTELYEGTRRMFESVLSRFGLSFISVDMTDVASVEQAFRTHDISTVWMETPTNPTLRVLDIRSVSIIAHRHDARVIVDTTMCSGIVQKPLMHGADMVVESLTKSINGHSDALGGFVGTNSLETGKQIRKLTQTTGCMLNPWESWLIQRGLKTADIRMRTAERNAARIAQRLSQHPAVERVCFPGSENAEEAKLRRIQMRGKGQIVTFVVSGAIDPSAFIRKLSLIRICHSFGGTETIIQQPALMMDFPEGLRPSSRLFRLSIGLENAQAIINDLLHALAD